MAKIVLDGLEIGKIEDVHALFIQALGMPEWYGRNLDALFDCLTSLGEDIAVHLCHREVLEERLGRRGTALTALLRRAGVENPHIKLFEED